MSRPLTTSARRGYLKIVHVAKRQLALSEAEYRELLERATGHRSAGELTTHEQFDSLLNALRASGFVSTAHPKPTRSNRRDPEALITGAQMAKLKRLQGLMDWSHEQMRGFSRRQCGKAWPQTRAEAINVIEGLRAIAKRAGKAVY